MNSHLGKAPMLESPTSPNQSLDSNILRPFKIQKVQIPTMETVFHYFESLNPHGIGTSSGMNFQPTSHASNNNQQNQQSPFEKQKQSPMSKKEDPFFYYQERYVQENVKSC